MDPTATEPVEWRTRAACRGMNPNVFYPSQYDTDAQRAAKAICAGCPVQLACLAEAVDRREDNGIWGGVSMSEGRKRMPGGQRRRPCRWCGAMFDARTPTGDGWLRYDTEACREAAGRAFERQRAMVARLRRAVLSG